MAKASAEIRKGRLILMIQYSRKSRFKNIKIGVLKLIKTVKAYLFGDTYFTITASTKHMAIMELRNFISASNGDNFFMYFFR